MAPYVYVPLGKSRIRLLELHEASSYDGDLQGTIHLMTLPEERELGSPNHYPSPPETDSPSPTTISVKYSALSHHWGPRGDTSSIRIITNSLTPHEITIRRNLEPALRQLRSKIKAEDEASRYFWIDAICINQKDPDDKDKQIPMMAHIYNGAQRVCVWLSDEFPGSNLGLEFVHKLKQLDGLTRLLKDDDTSAEWDAFFKLARQPWFSRRWIVQEIAVAKDAVVHCGSGSVRWDDFANAISLFASLKEEVRKLFQGLPQFHHNPDYFGDLMESGANKLVQAKSAIFRTKHDKSISEHLLSLEGLISILTVFDVEEPLDIVYSILWLSKDARPGPNRREAALNHPNTQPTPLQSREGTPEPNSPQPSEDNALILADPTRRSREDDSPGDEGDEGEDPERSRFRGPHLAVPSPDGRPGRPIERQHSPARDPIEINYKQSVFELCRETLKFIVDRSRSLDMMCLPWAPEPRTEDPRLKNLRDEPTDGAAERPVERFVPERGHPSWITLRNRAPFGLNRAGQSRRIMADPLVGRPGTGPRTYLACGKTRAKTTFVGRNLVVAGYKFEPIHKVEDPAMGGNIPPGWLRMANWPSSTSSPPDRFWRTLVADRGPDGRANPPAYYGLACQWAFDQRTAGDNLYPSQLLTFSECNPIAADFLRRAQAVVWQRSLFVLKGIRDPSGAVSDGYIGLAPSTAKPGDLVCILRGCSVPVVLRKVKKRTLDDSSSDVEARGRPVRRRRTGADVESDSPQSIPTFIVTGAESSGESGVEEEGGQEERHDVLVGGAGEKYLFIGECYVHGIMDGEAFQYMDDRGRVEEDFVLV